MKTKEWKKTLIKPESSILDAAKNLNKYGLRISLVVSKNNNLLGTITDGDIRRGLINGLKLTDPIKKIMNNKPIVINKDKSAKIVKKIMRLNKLYQMPIVDTDNKAIGLYSVENFSNLKIKNRLMIMAGGLGLRLRPITNKIPKPMIEISGKPILEHIINNSKNYGFKNFVISTYYLPHIIKNYFGDGSSFDVNIEYVEEKKPLGTAGSLALIKKNDNLPFVVCNGDILSDLNFSDILNFHNSNSSYATMAVRQYEFNHPFGVVETKGISITGFNEKPSFNANVNAGVYVFDSKIIDFMEKNQKCDMPELFIRLNKEKKKTIAYPIYEQWKDLGDLATLKKYEIKK